MILIRFVGLMVLVVAPYWINDLEFGGQYYWTAAFVGMTLAALFGFLTSIIGGLDAIEKKISQSKDRN